MRKTLLAFTLLSTLTAAPAFAWDRHITIVSKLYPWQEIESVEFSNNNGTSWSAPIDVDLTWWNPPYGWYPSKSVTLFSEVCDKIKLRFQIYNHPDVTTPAVNLCTQRVVLIAQATPVGGPKDPLSITFH